MSLARIRIEASLERVEELGRAARAAGLDSGLDEAAATMFELAVVEAANNIVIHGYAGGPGAIELELRRDAGGLVGVLRDQGRPAPAEAFAAAELPDDLLAEHGRGLRLILDCVSELAYASDAAGNELRLTVRLEAT